MGKGTGIGMTRRTGPLMVLVILIMGSILVGEGTFHTGMVGEADGIRPVKGYITLDPSGSNQRGNVVELTTGPGTVGFMDQFYGNVTIYRTSKVLRDKIMCTLYFETEDPSLVIGSVFPRVFDVQPGGKIAYQGFVVNIQLASPMLAYSTGLNPMVRVKVWGEWMAQWSAKNNGTWDSGIIEPYYIYVHIKPYHYLQMSFDPAMLDISPGGTGEIDVIVMNMGNGMERVDLTIPNENTYAKEGWIFEFNTTTLTIGPRSEARARIRVTSPRNTVSWHMETKDFSVLAVSYYDKYQSTDEGREPLSYEMTFMVYIFGMDFTFIPWAWAFVFWVVFALILFNMGIDPLVMRRRRLPRGKEPGFKALKALLERPERRARLKARREEAGRERRERRERERLERARAAERKQTAKEERAPSTEREIERAPLLDLRRKEVEELDLTFTDSGPSGRRGSGTEKVGNDDFDIVIPDRRGKKGKGAGRSLFSRAGRKKGPGRTEEELKEVLEEL